MASLTRSHLAHLARHLLAAERRARARPAPRGRRIAHHLVGAGGQQRGVGGHRHLRRDGHDRDLDPQRLLARLGQKAARVGLGGQDDHVGRQRHLAQPAQRVGRQHAREAAAAQDTRQLGARPGLPSDDGDGGRRVHSECREEDSVRSSTCTTVVACLAPPDGGPERSSGEPLMTVLPLV